MGSKPSTDESTQSELPEDQAFTIPSEEFSEISESEVSVDYEAELLAQRERYLRLQAEMENLRARTAREIADHQRFAAMGLIRDLLPAVDNIERAIEAAEKAGDSTTLLEGFKLVRQQLLATLEQHHCRPIEALGAVFDPQFHAAIAQQP